MPLATEVASARRPCAPEFGHTWNDGVPQVAVLQDLCVLVTIAKHRSANTPTCGTRHEEEEEEPQITQMGFYVLHVPRASHPWYIRDEKSQLPNLRNLRNLRFLFFSVSSVSPW